MKTEELTALGLTEEQAQKVFAMNGKDIERHKAAAETAKTEAEGLKNQLINANKKLEGFDPEWKAKSEQAEKDAQAKVLALKMDYAIDAALRTAGAKNASIARGQIDREKLVIDGDKVIGLDQQIAALKSGEATAFLFAAEQSTKTGLRQSGSESTPDGNAEVNAAIRAAFGKEGQ